VTRRLERATTRRRFVQGLAAGGVLASAGAWLPRRAALAASADVASLPGPVIALAIGAHQVNVTGVTRSATLAHGTLPGPIPRCREGDDVTLCVRNDLGVDTTIHWHGVLTPSGRRRHTAALLSASSSSDVRRSEETAPTASREARTPCRTSCVP